MVEPTIVLASGSPRRAELLRRIGLDPVVRPADVDETPLSGETAIGLVTRLARAKAEASQPTPDEVVVAADTVVVLGDEVLGKPRSPDDAVAMLQALSGRTHHVLTGVHVLRDGRSGASVEETSVRFRTLSDAEVTSYVATGEPLEMAGAYGIQGAGGMFVESITGSDSNVIGLPLATVVRLAAELGVELLPR